MFGGLVVICFLVQLPCFRAATPKVNPVCDIGVNRSSAIRNSKEFAPVKICNLMGSGPRKRPAVNLSRTVVQSEVLAVVVYWMNNSVRVAQKHYLQITDDHLKAGCGMKPDGQVVAQVVADSSLIAPHAVSAKSQTLKNKAFPVIDYHGPSVAFCA
jgi:hypothetical protein